MSFDTVEKNRAFAEKFEFNFPLLCDTDRAMGIAYGACSGPSDGYARRISILIGADGAIEHVVDNVNAKTHPSTLLEEL